MAWVARNFKESWLFLLVFEVISAGELVKWCGKACFSSSTWSQFLVQASGHHCFFLHFWWPDHCQSKGRRLTKAPFVVVAPQAVTCPTKVQVLFSFVWSYLLWRTNTRACPHPSFPQLLVFGGSCTGSRRVAAGFSSSCFFMDSKHHPGVKMG